MLMMLIKPTLTDVNGEDKIIVTAVYITQHNSTAPETTLKNDHTVESAHSKRKVKTN